LKNSQIVGNHEGSHWLLASYGHEVLQWDTEDGHPTGPAG